MVGRFNCSMLDCILSSSEAARNIADHRQENFKALLAMLEKKEEPIDEIIFICSGTSSTSSLTAKVYVEKISGLRTSVIYPNDFIHNTFVRNPNALYVFISQTGTSKVCFEAMRLVQRLHYTSAVISETAETPMAKEADCFITMDCGIEEYPMRTVGYSATVMTEMALAITLAEAMGKIDTAKADQLTEEIRQSADRIPVVVEKTLAWLKSAKRNMLRSELIVFTGPDALYGVSLEGAMKVWETPQIASVGYEIEEGIHGPNYGYNSRHCVIVLNDGGRENDKCRALARYMKEVWGNGFLIGANPVDENDLAIDVVPSEICAVDFAAAVQTIAYKLAEDQGRDLYAHHDNSRMNSYFKTHQ